jgi:polygalacturonase
MLFSVWLSVSAQSKVKSGFTDAASFGFSPGASGIENAKAMQRAVDKAGTVVVSEPGVYKIAATVYLGSNTSVVFGNDVFLKKVDEQGAFSHVFVNKGAITKTYDQNITVEGLQIIVNGIDVRTFKEAYGLHGQLAFFYIKDLRIDRFRCLDLGKAQYGIQVCTFEDIIINDVIIKGDKDGVHLGRGKRFRISNGVFETFDDAIALNGHDYSTGNPELGWIEDGIVENCHDLAAAKTTGYFCRILAGGWMDWKPGMEVQQSDAVVSNGRVYRVQAKPDGKVYKSTTQPTHKKGSLVLDGINWGVVQNDITYTAGVRNVVFRDIYLEKARIAFSIHFDNDKYSRSYYPGAEIPKQEQLVFDNIKVLYNQPKDLIQVDTPIDAITISNSSFRNNSIHFYSNKAMTDYFKTRINIYGCVFNAKGKMDLMINDVENKEILLKTAANIYTNDEFSASVNAGKGKIIIESDLPGLNGK